MHIENQKWGLNSSSANLTIWKEDSLPPLAQLTHLPHLFFSFSAANSCPTSPRGGHGGLGGLGGNKRVNAENLVQAAYAAMEDKGDIANTGW